tara:strand:- start:1284 stop:2489 length:1206 start_codon:yes stop_codon:yes gene_type:complete
MSKFLVLVVVILLAALIIYAPNLIRLYKLSNLYNEDTIAYNFINMDEFFFTSDPIAASDNPHIFEESYIELPEMYTLDGKEYNLKESLDYFCTDGLIILRDDTILYEQYWNGNDRYSKHISWSVAKSFLSALVGIALDEGLIDSIEDPATKYLPDFKGTGYEGVKIKNILQMSSGVAFNEDYADPDSDINKFGRAAARGTPFRDFAKTLENGKEQGTYNHYVSIDTQVLAMILETVTGMPLREYLSKKIWSKIGMESEAYYITDKSGVDMALGGLNATLRDYAKFGYLYLNNGNWFGEQIVPEDWVKASHTPDAAHLMPNAGELSSNDWGYGYQWWVPGNPLTDFAAHGVYNQFIYVDPESGIVIAKTSSNHRFRSEKEYTKDAHIAMFRSIAQHIKEETK